MSIRKQLGNLIAENRQLYPLPAELKEAGMSRGRPGYIASAGSLSDANRMMKEKIKSTELSNAIGRGEAEPTPDRFSRLD
jgi:isopenicillin N synthase-like dioxygenase